jgi:hypothetical protein
LLPVFAIGIFIEFTISQTGLVRHWLQQRGRGWVSKAALNGTRSGAHRRGGSGALRQQIHGGCLAAADRARADVALQIARRHSTTGHSLEKVAEQQAAAACG